LHYGKLNIICFGAHPDDAEYKSGGTAALWASMGHRVKLVSVTNGEIGHWQMAGGPLAKRRTAESAEVAKRLGVTSQVLDIHDGELLPTHSKSASTGLSLPTQKLNGSSRSCLSRRQTSPMSVHLTLRAARR